MKVFVDRDCLLHDPPFEILSGKPVPYFESPARWHAIKHELESSPSFQIAECDSDIDVLGYAQAIHHRDYIQYLRNAYEDWVADGNDKTAVLPETFQHPKLLSPLPSINDSAEALSPIAKAGLYCFDLSCPITEETYTAVLASLRVTLSAAKHLILAPSHSGVFALSRPPGHHAGSSLSGGYCFINNVAAAVRLLQTSYASEKPQEGQGESHRLGRVPVAILDIDYHHGNGTQEIFYTDGSVLYVSLHAQNDYPYFTGSTKEKGSGMGIGCNINFPLPRGTTDQSYCDTLREAVACVQQFEPVYVVISLGVDTYADDPISDFALTQGCYGEIGQIIGQLHKPVLFVMEGGYDIKTIGTNVRAVLEGFENVN